MVNNAVAAADVAWNFVYKVVSGCVIDVDVDGCIDAVGDFVRK